MWIGVGYFNPTFSIASFKRSFITLHISQETKSAENVKLRIKLLVQDQRQSSLEFKSGNLESEKFFLHRFSPAVWHNPSPLWETIDSPACYIRYICALCSGRTHNHSNVLHYWKPLQLTNLHWGLRTSNTAISFFINFCRVCVTWNIVCNVTEKLLPANKGGRVLRALILCTERVCALHTKLDENHNWIHNRPTCGQACFE